MPDMSEQTYNLSIFGSCVSRDILNHGEPGIIKLKTYIARQTVISSMASPCSPVLHEEDIRLDSSFQRRMVLADTTKTAFSQFENDGSDYLLIDMIDERLGMIYWGGTVVTNSLELVNSGLLDGKEKKVKYFKSLLGEYFADKKPIANKFEAFCQRVSEIYNQKNIIIHVAQAKTKYLSADGSIKSFDKDNNKKSDNLNRMYSAMYELLIKNIPNAKIIDICGDYLASENHRWGLNNIHYEDAYYELAFKKLINLIQE